MPKYMSNLKDCGYKTFEERSIDVQDFRTRHVMWPWEYIFDCDAIHDSKTDLVYCPVDCPYYKELCGESVSNKFSFKNINIVVFEQMENIDVSELKNDDIVYMETKQGNVIRSWYGKVQKVSEHNIWLIVYDGPIAGIAVDKNTINICNTKNESRRFGITTITCLRKANLIEKEHHVKIKEN